MHVVLFTSVFRLGHWAKGEKCCGVVEVSNHRLQIKGDCLTVAGNGLVIRSLLRGSGLVRTRIFAFNVEIGHCVARAIGNDVGSKAARHAICNVCARDIGTIFELHIIFECESPNFSALS